MIFLARCWSRPGRVGGKDDGHTFSIACGLRTGYLLIFLFSESKLVLVVFVNDFQSGLKGLRHEILGSAQFGTN